MKNLTLAILLTACFCSTSAFSTIESPERISKTSKVYFTQKYISIDEFQEKETIDFIKYDKNINLFIRAFHDQPLLDYLKELSTDSSEEALINAGNYQFTFLVDGKKIYTENLNAGAGTKESKSKWSSMMVPLTTKKKIDSWGRFLWNRFLGNGGKMALTNGQHHLTIEIRPYVEIEELKVGPIISEGSIIIEKPQKNISQKKTMVQKIEEHSDFKTSNAKIDFEKIKQLNTAIASEEFQDITSIVVLKAGEILLEEYFNGAKRKTLHDTRSVGKTIAGTMTGIAIKEGHLRSTNQSLNEFYKLSSYDNYDAKKEAICIEDLLTMSTGLEGFDFDTDSPGQEENMYPTKDWVKFGLDLPMDKNLKSGKDWRYLSAGAVLLGDIIHQRVPGGLDKYTLEKLFKPLNIEKYKWQYTPTGVPNTAGSLKLSSLDYAKIGQLYSNQGLWQGQEIFLKEWASNSLDQKVEIPFLEDHFYGYMFWNKSYEVSGKKYEISYASGNGGNKILIFKDIPVVIVITAQAYNQPFMHNQVDDIVRSFLLPAILN